MCSNKVMIYSVSVLKADSVTSQVSLVSSVYAAVPMDISITGGHKGDKQPYEGDMLVPTAYY